MEFYWLRPRQFDQNIAPFELMTSPVTQKQWVGVMGSNPSLFLNHKSRVTLSIRGKLVSFLPRHPVENITQKEKELFVKRFNEIANRDATKKQYDYRLPNLSEAFWISSQLNDIEEFSPFGKPYYSIQVQTFCPEELTPELIQDGFFFRYVGNRLSDDTSRTEAGRSRKDNSHFRI